MLLQIKDKVRGKELSFAVSQKIQRCTPKVVPGCVNPVFGYRRAIHTSLYETADCRFIDL